MLADPVAAIRPQGDPRSPQNDRGNLFNECAPGVRQAASEWPGCSLVRIPRCLGDYCGMTFYRLRLSYVFEAESPVFLTWRLQDSLPPHRGFPSEARDSGQAFAATDRLLDEAREGPAYFRQPAVADMIVETIQFNANILGHCRLHAFVVMPNHVHLLATPAVALPKLTKWLKGATAARANAILGLTDNPFWQEESYDRLVRYERE